MNTPTAFPADLLSQPASERLAYFMGKVVAHPHLKQTHQQVMDLLHSPSDVALVMVVGPTGVGKTTLRRRIQQQVIEESFLAAEGDPGQIPIVALDVVAVDTTRFNWRDYYLRVLLALDEPLISRKLDYGVRGIYRGAGGSLVVEATVESAALRRAVESCLCHRRLKALILDEAQHLRKAASGRRLLDQMDVLKSLSGTSGTLHILVGTYELRSLTDLSAQLSRRTVEIHFGRYRADIGEERFAFQSVLLTFQRYMPLFNEPDLVSQWEYLYEHSAGCVGILKGWLNQALGRALTDECATLKREHLEVTALPARKVVRLAREIREGEDWLAENRQVQDQVRALLGVGGEAPPTQASPGAHQNSAEPRRGARRTGQRLPERDVIGNKSNGEG